MDFEKLEVWQRSSRLCIEVIRELENLAFYGFRDQICRSALSIPSNIAEGMERGFPKEKQRFLGYAKGSCGELRTQLYIAKELGFMGERAAATALSETKEVSAMLHGLMKRIQQDSGSVSEREPPLYV